MNVGIIFYDGKPTSIVQATRLKNFNTLFISDLFFILESYENSYVGFYEKEKLDVHKILTLNGVVGYIIDRKIDGEIVDL